MAYNPFDRNAYLGNGQYDQLEVLRKSKDPLINYEGLYEDAPSNIATSNIFKAMQPEFEYRNPNFLEHAERKGMVDLAGNVPIDRNRRIDFGRYWSNRPLSATDGVARFEDFNPRVGQPLGYQEAEADQEIDEASLSDPFTNNIFEQNETISTPNETVSEELIDENLIPQNFRTRMNNPFFERPTLSNASSLANYFNQGLGGIKGVKEKMGQGWDFAQQLPGMAMSALSGIPGIGALMGMLPKTSPEQKAMMELYNSDQYQDVLNQIPGMANYNPVYGMGAGYGLTNAIGKRLATINKTLGRMTPEQLAKTSLKKRKQKLEELAALEASKDFARTGASGRRPGSGGGGQGTPDSGGTTGGYSYDRGGRQGYGYGLKYGGRVGYANGGLASLFTRRG